MDFAASPIELFFSFVTRSLKATEIIVFHWTCNLQTKNFSKKDEIIMEKVLNNFNVFLLEKNCSLRRRDHFLVLQFEVEQSMKTDYSIPMFFLKKCVWRKHYYQHFLRRPYKEFRCFTSNFCNWLMKRSIFRKEFIWKPKVDAENSWLSTHPKNSIYHRILATLMSFFFTCRHTWPFISQNQIK